VRILVTGASGLVGAEVVRALAGRGRLADRAGSPQPIGELVLADLAAPVPPPVPDGMALQVERVDLASAEGRARLFARPFDGLFHLAALLTARAEMDFERGLQMNLLGLIDILEHCRRQPKPPRVVFSSSMAVFGGELPPVADDATLPAPETSYGAHKVAAEYLLADYSRRGFLDGRALRLPVIVFRPAGGPPSLSDRIGAVVREPLEGRDVDCPLAPDAPMPMASARAAANALVDLYEVPQARLGSRRAMNLPSLSVTAAEMAAALARFQGSRPLGRIRWLPEPAVQAMIGSMPGALASAHAEALGIRADASFAAILDTYLEASAAR